MTSSRTREFVIPLEKDDLLVARVDAYTVKEIVPINLLSRAVDATRIHFNEHGTEFINDHFDTFFSILVHTNKVEFRIMLQAFDRILKAVSQLIDEMEALFEEGSDISVPEKTKYRSINKMYAYLLSSLASAIEDHVIKNSNDVVNIGKRKKASQKSDKEADWEPRKQKALELIYRWFQLPIQKLWTPPIVEDLFISNLAQFCYKVLEHSRDAKNKCVRETIFEILGTLVKRYNQGITCVVRIIQLVQLYDALAVPLAVGVVHMVEETGCKSFIVEMMREIGQNELGETEARNTASFLEAVASTKPELALGIIDEITEHLGNEVYSMRSCVVGILGAIILGCLTGEAITDEKRHQRDECLRNLFEHICDGNAYVRSKVLQVWQNLCCARAVPVKSQVTLMEAVIARLEDKSAQVRKLALQLLRALVQCNPFAAKLDREYYSKKLEKERSKLKELRVSVASMSTCGDRDRVELWKSLLPEIRRAIAEALIDESKDDSLSDDDDEENDEEDREFDAAAEFEDIRRLMLTEEVTEAVDRLQKIFRRLPDSPNMHRMKQEARENCLIVCLQKIFEESESHPEPDAASGGRSSAETGAEAETSKDHEARMKELKKRKEELAARRDVVRYIENCFNFAQELELAIPKAEILMFSTTAGVAIEACSFLGTASQFGVRSALDGVRKALFQVNSRDPSVRNNVASVYKEIYLTKADAGQSSRQKALASVKGLVELLQGLEGGQSQALAQLVGAWRANGDLGTEELQVMWAKFSMIIPDTSAIESRAALCLLTMAAETEPALVIENLDVLIKVGFGPRAKEDLLLARDTCRALLKFRRDPDDPLKPPLRYPNDHEMFQEISTLVIEEFDNMNVNGYLSFAADAINVIYHLANCPGKLSKHILREIAGKKNFMEEPAIRGIEAATQNRRSGGHDSQASMSQIPSTENARSQTQSHQNLIETKFEELTRLLSMVGQISIRELVYLDVAAYKELKRRNTHREMKKGNKPSKPPVSTPASAQRSVRTKEAHNASTTAEDVTEEVLVGATADDTDADLITTALETEIVTGKGLIAHFVPLVLHVCRYPDKFNDELLQATAVLALCRMMTVSSAFCVQHLQLLVTIMERSPHPGIRANVLIGLSDLTSRFPNKIEPWTSHLYGRLRDKDKDVRCTSVKVLSNLIMREMIRVKGQVSGLALCIIDDDETIRETTKQFFKDLSQKGNALYNVMPDILSHLMDPELNLEEKDFQEIIKYVLGLQQKERQVDTIIDKLCSRLKLATVERQWRDLAYCLSLLTFNAKSIRHLMDSLPQLKDKIYNTQVMKSLKTIIETTKKKPEAKAACIELEQKIETLSNSLDADEGNIDDRVAMPPPPVPKPKKKSRRIASRRSSSSDEDDDDDNEDGSEDDETENTAPPSARKKTTRRNSEKRKKPAEPATPSPLVRRIKKNKPLEVASPNTSEATTPRRSARSKKRL